MKILLAEDDAEVAKFIIAGFEESGHSVDHVTDGRDALSYCTYNECEVAVLDRMMPGMDGLNVLKALRAAGQNMPVLMLTALGDVDNRVEGLQAGADDYLAKPFHFSELMARVLALTRRRTDHVTQTELEVHDLTLDLLARTARRQHQLIELQTKEFALLEILMRNAGRIVTRTMLLEKVWNFNFDPNTSVVETHISRLRSKVDKPYDVPLIHTIRNTGYSMHGPR
ncbi:response regulator [Pseudosulfitobacter pseudonitzschiae]|uniref:response regulator n=1 Tax=Pseudosulfitobacter pseudonitzschiae TaxID=1402135 RepID=UPI001AFB4BE6|nr:response regulator transcription factor [Pseudosulfitobacter pseudonitzschiae]MBM1816150.1 response regulator transcription factor [Pseudosulfitobacter pseudonitzschiae]MBM1833456.1 response regulator transcription factor [Pseudosulfitobacter pseudonitzschiae]MBM1838323.1 response regulator transcription factor [Pseudosulfitobacter pseudonitzschiae]MBM1842855.1 response regulator transcription factor [Pseudosulfitobacter pseudonitzschiae]MBM1847721.1 response regulator transcription factor 